MSKLHRSPRIHHQHLIRVHDRVQSVCYGQDGAVFEVFTYRGLDQSVSRRIHIGSRFVQNQNSVVPDDGPSQTDQLALTRAEVRAPFVHPLVQTVDGVFQFHLEAQKSRGIESRRQRTSSKARHKVASSHFSNGSRLYRRVLENNTGSWGMMEMCDLRSFRPMNWMLTRSISMAPSTLVRRKRAEMREDFPAPVRPTMPT
jgi:hypothetical protein